MNDAQESNQREEFVERAPFRTNGFLLSDNGAQFCNREFIKACTDLGLIFRTTHRNSPWSNGKVEALNKTLKYQCLPVICQSYVPDFERKPAERE